MTMPSPSSLVPIVSSSIPAVAGESGPVLRLKCRGGGEELMGIAALNLVLSILTLGFYRFWGRTRLRRYLWSRTFLDDEPFEYAGTGLELFLGFLRLCFLFFLCYCALLGAAFVFDFAESVPGFGAVYTALIYVAGFVLYPLAFYFSWRYRLSRTTWRGIRASLRGSAFVYFLRWVGWMLAVVFSFGLAIPLRNIALKHYLLNHCMLGDRTVTFDGNGRDLFGAFLLPWSIATGLGIAVTVLIASGMDEVSVDAAMDAADRIEVYFTAFFPLLLAYAGVWLCVFLPLYLLLYKKKEMQYILDRLSWGDLRFSGTFRFWPVVRFFVMNFLLVTLTMGVGYPYTVLRSIRFLAETVRISGFIDVDALCQNQARKPTFGEGLAAMFAPDGL